MQTKNNLLQYVLFLVYIIVFAAVFPVIEEMGQQAVSIKTDLRLCAVCVSSLLEEYKGKPAKLETKETF